MPLTGVMNYVFCIYVYIDWRPTDWWPTTDLSFRKFPM